MEAIIRDMVEAALPYRVVLVKLGLAEWTRLREELVWHDGQHVLRIRGRLIPVDYVSRKSAIIMEVAA